MAGREKENEEDDRAEEIFAELEQCGTHADVILAVMRKAGGIGRATITFARWRER
jgi:hypothetical protein